MIISAFWLQNPDYWIETNKAKQAIVDKIIYDKFYTYDYANEDRLGIIIYLDQFYRHFSRINSNITESLILENRMKACSLVENMDPSTLITKPEAELIWYLMPWKHTANYKPIFNLLDLLQKKKPLDQLLSRFFMDTYKKAYNDEAVKANLIRSQSAEPFDPNVCALNPPFWLTYKTVDSSLTTTLKQFKKVTVSLSGGVDSMLLSALLKARDVDVVAVHIVYGNRLTSEDERAFIASFCDQLQIPLYVYKIEHLRRQTVDRAFYESMTRTLRFAAYKALDRPVILGHIQEDVIENIWTNLAKGTHLDNLAALTNQTVESGVTVFRPWLHTKKDMIYETAKKLNIPYLKDTTPPWSNRGKFRTTFHQATKQQYGPSVDDKLLQVAERYKAQASILDKLLYQAISNSYDPENKTIDVTQAINVGLDTDGWLRIFTDLAHNKLNKTMPTYKSCAEFVRRLQKDATHNQVIHLKKDLSARLIKTNSQILLKFNNPNP
jgi:tRNA(Ile)-lysidine synthetase-like protein